VDRGFYILRKLFNTGSSVTIEDFTTLRVIGPYSLLKLGPDFAIIDSEEYRIEVSGNDLTVETLAEEVAVFTFTSITSMNVTTGADREAAYDA
jgi:hypothetical protein